MTEMNAAARLAIAALVGLAVGVEREWSGQTGGRPPHFAGCAPSPCSGVGGCSGLLLANGYPGVAAALAAGAMALTVAAYVMTVRTTAGDPDGTTEVAALLVVALGALAGLDLIAIAAGAGAVVVLLLGEKQALHGAVRHVRQEELRAALRFSVLALVVLPLLPEGPLLGPLELRPRAIWMIVLVFSALNFAGFIARRAVGDRRGYELVGLLGGLISSTAVTLEFSRHSRREPAIARSLALGVIGACTVLIPRVLIVSAVLNPRVSWSLLPVLAPAMLAGGIVLLPPGDPRTAPARRRRSPPAIRCACGWRFAWRSRFSSPVGDRVRAVPLADVRPVRDRRPPGSDRRGRAHGRDEPAQRAPAAPARGARDRGGDSGEHGLQALDSGSARRPRVSTHRHGGVGLHGPGDRAGTRAHLRSAYLPTTSWAIKPDPIRVSA